MPVARNFFSRYPSPEPRRNVDMDNAKLMARRNQGPIKFPSWVHVSPCFETSRTKVTTTPHGMVKTVYPTLAK